MSVVDRMVVGSEHRETELEWVVDWDWGWGLVSAFNSVVFICSG